MSVAATRSNGFRKVWPLLAALAVFSGACGGDDGAARKHRARRDDRTDLCDGRHQHRDDNERNDPNDSSDGNDSGAGAGTGSDRLGADRAGRPADPGSVRRARAAGRLRPAPSRAGRRGPRQLLGRGSPGLPRRHDGCRVARGRHVPPPPEADGPLLSCLDQEISDVIGAALAWHREHPDSQPEVSYAKAVRSRRVIFPIYGMTAVLVGEQDFDGGSVGDVRIEFEIASRPDLDADEIRAEVDGEEVSLELRRRRSGPGYPPRSDRSRRRVGGWGTPLPSCCDHLLIERSDKVELPLGDATPSTTEAEPPESLTTTTT